jgi:hypothetical protein
MDRVFLAVIVAGLLLAATSVSLLVATGRNPVAELKLPPGVSADQLKAQRIEATRSLRTTGQDRK